MGRLTFRTIFGGPSMPDAYRTELEQIKSASKEIEFLFDLDLSLTIGSDMVPVTYATGLRNPRIHLKTQTVTGAIFINEDDTKSTSDHAKLLRHLVAGSLEDIFTRLEKKVPEFDGKTERKKVGFLSD